ncbi:GFA family protein [Parasphingorhabdus flavimaris]|uniref:GFA family protein n=1 Tax=Parasphingorhabdus flavimaris TaxID=266812 RepID=A0ABX2MZY7_9SPHN|nr:GFA family protein [Parasphingorhabdus flavimaris]NVD26997.1 GFA family protein [Parasphingorhabdus flavimaris]|tara:strand:- start:5832 stop:6281 length:450 start_codon:yes stop_codon:yes gene_type:complete
MTTPQNTPRQGHCLCGAVTITAKNAASHVDACHCRMCRRWGGGPFVEIDCGTDVLIKGADRISVYHSSEWAERAFCADCGSHLFYRLKDSGEHMVCAGLFDDATDKDASLSLRRQVFIDEKPSYYSFAGDSEMLTGAELFAMIEAGQQP